MRARPVSRPARLSVLLILLASAGGALVACSGDDTSVPDAGGTDAAAADARAGDASVVDAGGTDASPDAGADAGPDASGQADAADAAAVDAGDPCATDGGDAGFTTYTFDWSYAVSSTALNGGKGQVITVRRCDSVRWHNADGETHSVFSADAPINTGDILFNETSAPIQMKRVGVFPYICGIHGSVMSGELTVK